MQTILSDEAILGQGKNREQYELLLKRYLKSYKMIIRDVADNLNQKFYDQEDFLYEFYVSFHKAYSNYQNDKGSFFSYFKTIFKRKVTLSMIKTIRSKDALDHAISLNHEIDEGTTLFDLIENENADDPVSNYRINNAKLILKEATGFRRRGKRNCHYKALMLRTQGLTYKEISEQLNINISQVRRYFKNDDNLRFKDIKIDLR